MRDQRLVTCGLLLERARDYNAAELVGLIIKAVASDEWPVA